MANGPEAGWRPGGPLAHGGPGLGRLSPTISPGSQPMKRPTEKVRGAPSSVPLSESVPLHGAVAGIREWPLGGCRQNYSNPEHTVHQLCLYHRALTCSSRKPG